jgi:hypothetical protein
MSITNVVVRRHGGLQADDWLRYLYDNGAYPISEPIGPLATYPVNGVGSPNHEAPAGDTSHSFWEDYVPMWDQLVAESDYWNWYVNG